MTNSDVRSVLGRYARGKLDREGARSLLESARRPTRAAPLDIAVIGMAGQFPGAADVREFWRNLENGQGVVGELPASYLDPGGGGYRWGGALTDRDSFDASFFGISGVEADSMNPHQRLVLQESWHALEDAGYDPRALRGSRTGMFIGAEPAGYLHETLSGASDALVASRLSYVLDLRGPALVVNTACSSALAAVHLACESLRGGESALALAGGVYAGLDQRSLNVLAESGMLSASGRCRTFDAAADGTVFSEAVAVVVLKRLADAVADGDHVHGVIRAGGMNQDGASNGITAPNGAAQEQLITDVYRRYGIDPERISYVEAHGTATPLGDPVEANALVRAFGRFTGRRAYCAVGSAKAHIGHCGAAAGAVGLIKVLLSMRHGRHVGMPTLRELNPLIELDGSALTVDDTPRPWQTEPGVPRTAAVSSFGHSGTNVHLVVEEYRPAGRADQAGTRPERYLVPVSARDPERLRDHAGRLAAFLQEAEAGTPVARDRPDVIAPARLRQLLAGVLEVEPEQLAEDEPFSDFGVDPGHLARLETLIEAESGRPADEAVVHRARSLTDLARLLAARHAAPDAPVPPAVDLAAVAHTLQRGREAMAERAAFVVRDLTELVAGLKALAVGEASVEGCRRGEVAAAGVLADLFASDAELAGAIGRRLEQGELETVAELWANGVPVDWGALYRHGAPTRIPLPGYPFAREYHGKDPDPSERVRHRRGADREAAPVGHGGPRRPATAPADRPVPEADGSATSRAGREELERGVRLRISELVSETVGVPAADVDPYEPLDTYGVDSLARTRMNHQLARLFAEASRTLLFEFATVADLAAHLVAEFPAECRAHTGPEQGPEAGVESGGPAGEAPAAQEPADVRRPSAPPAPDPALPGVPAEDGIAVIGVSGRFPGAPDLGRYWENLIAGHTAVSEVPAARWDWREHYDPEPTGEDRFRKSHSKWGAFLDGVDEFDPLFFGLAPQEARNIDPQERIFLQECWKAMEDAGCSPAVLPEHVRRRTGVFAGAAKHGFERHGVESGLELPRTSFGALVNRVSYHLDLGGPSQPVDTACSSALVAVHAAAESIRRGECELALAGGVNLYLHPSAYAELGAAMMLSDRPDCAAFGSEANGILPGEGVGVVVLKSHRRALDHGDHVYAVIRGGAVNHNGRGTGFTTPSPQRQADVVRAALDRAKVDPRTVNYIESSVNGSAIGDAVEMTGLTQVFGQRGGASGDYWLGTVKPNVGHGEASSGMSQLFKVVLALRHRVLPPTRVPRDLNPAIDFARLPFGIPRAAVDWRPVVVDGAPAPLRAGITGVGAGGVNAHLVLEEPLRSPRHDSPPAPGPVLFTLSARTPERLGRYVDHWLDFLDGDPAVNLAAVAYTLQTGREAMRYRLAVVASAPAGLRRALRQWRAAGDADGVFGGDAGTVARAMERPPAAAGGPRPGSDLAATAREWVSGAGVDWTGLYAGGDVPTRVPGLPTYPFEPRRCWADAPSAEARPVHAPSPGGRTAEPGGTPAGGQVPGTPSSLFSSFAPFLEPVPGFSASRVLLGLAEDPHDVEIVLERQREMRAVLFHDVPLDRMGAVLDFGCGPGDDVVDLATRCPRLLVHGATGDKAQAESAARRIEERGLAGRAAVFHTPGPDTPFPATYDLALGVEAVCRAEDQPSLLAQLDTALVDGGLVLLADYIARLRGDIVDRDLGFHVPSADRWVRLLARHRLVIEELVDLSPQIAHFLTDPEVARNTAGLPAEVRDAWRSHTNQATSLRRGWLNYCLFRLRKDAGTSETERVEVNARRITEAVPYLEVRHRAAARTNGTETGSGQVPGSRL
ncbi:beta-ketoacyl synthase N-terminal-like domain-containing protein [Streptomyces sp. LZ34]